MKELKEQFDIEEKKSIRKMQEEIKEELQVVLDRLQSEVTEKEAKSKMKLETKLKVNAQEITASLCKDFIHILYEPFPLYWFEGDSRYQ